MKNSTAFCSIFIQADPLWKWTMCLLFKTWYNVKQVKTWKPQPRFCYINHSIYSKTAVVIQIVINLHKKLQFFYYKKIVLHYCIGLKYYTNFIRLKYCTNFIFQNQRTCLIWIKINALSMEIKKACQIAQTEKNNTLS